MRGLRRLALERLDRSFNGELRDELLNREWFQTQAEAKVMIERWRCFCNE